MEKETLLAQDTSSCCRVCQVQFGLSVSSTRLFMGRNRKFVLEDELQQAVILRGPRPPSVKWDKSIPATKSGVLKQAQPGSGKKPEVKTKQHGQTSSFPVSRGDVCCAQSSGEVEDSARHFCARQSSCNPARAGGVVGRWVKRLTALQEKERTIPSPFTIPEPVVSGCVQAEISLQSVIDGLHKELASLRSGQPVQATSVDDDDDMMDSRHKRSKMAPKLH